MKATIISMCIVLVLCLALCFSSMFVIYSAIDEMDSVRIEALEAAHARKKEEVGEKITRLANIYKNRVNGVEMFASHDDLHDAYCHIVEARVCWEAGDYDDLYQALTLMGESLEHLHSHESLRWSNIY